MFKKNVSELRQTLLSAVMDAGVNQVLANVPDTGKFRPVVVKMHYYGTEHDGFLYVEHSAAHGCAIRASINPKGTDMEISNYVFFGSKQDCIDWLKDTAQIDTLMEVYNHLAKKADDRT